MPLASNIEIRPVIRHGDIKCAETVVSAWVPVYRGVLADKIVNAMTPEKMLEDWGNREDVITKANSKDISFGAFDGDKMLGMVYGPTPPADPKFKRFSAWMDLLYIRPEAQRMGIGKALFKAFIKEVIASGGKSMVLACLRDNDPSRAFYDALGANLEPEGGIWHGANKIHYGWNDLDKLAMKLDG